MGGISPLLKVDLLPQFIETLACPLKPFPIYTNIGIHVYNYSTYVAMYVSMFIRI